MKILIVHAHHEPRSFSSALFRQAVSTLCEEGHDVAISNLYEQQFDPVSDRRNFVTVHDPDYLKQQFEERHATDMGGFAPSLEAEILKLEACDFLIFNFPLWWFGLPSILKGWVDRVFAMRRVYGEGKLYETGLGKASSRAMTVITTGAGAEAYTGFGMHPSLETIMAPVNHGIFWFNGFLPLDPFVAWGPARASTEHREAYLRQLDQRLRGIENEQPRRLPWRSDFDSIGKDQKRRFMITLTRTAETTPAEARHLAELKKTGVLLDNYSGSPDAGARKQFMVFRAAGVEEVREHLESLAQDGGIEIVALDGA